jgi:hypothetical protein
VEFLQKKDARKKAESSLECRIIADSIADPFSLKVGLALAKAAALRITLN